MKLIEARLTKKTTIIKTIVQGRLVTSRVVVCDVNHGSAISGAAAKNGWGKCLLSDAVSDRQPAFTCRLSTESEDLHSERARQFANSGTMPPIGLSNCVLF